MKISIKILLSTALVYTTLIGCGSSRLLTLNPETADNVPEKIADLSESELKNWSHLDLAKDTVPGMSVDKAYDEIIKNKKGKSVIVAVIDSGIDIDHEDLRNVVWTNGDEIPNNGKDDDNNGYIDDVHGWNFLGKAYNEQLEYVRLLAKGDTNNPDYGRAIKDYDEDFEKYTGLKKQYDRLQKQYSEYKTNYEQLLVQISDADDIISKYFNKKEYSEDDVKGIETTDQSLQKSISIINYVYSIGFKSAAAAKAELQAGLVQINDDLGQFDDGLVDINDHLNYNLKKDLNGRKTGDNPDDITDIPYGDNNVKPTVNDENHGTHVSGIIAAEWNNSIGIDGVANNVKIMALRVVPNGDEYDKDVALAIRYAADNGAKIVNMSFGKYYSPHSDWVRDAIIYAAQKDVLLVHAAGNDSFDLDQKDNYPNDQISNGPEIADNCLTVGAIVSKYGSELVADYSNYGKINVDVFAPGSKIYSTVPNNDYKFFNGTSMASPAVAGVGAVIRSMYPDLTAAQVKHIIMDSGLPLNLKVKVGEGQIDETPFKKLSQSGKIVNLYNALIMASKISHH